MQICSKCGMKTGLDDLKSCPNGCGLLKSNEDKLVSCLTNIILSCVHPDSAARCVMVDLKPIRDTLKPIIGVNKTLGIT